MQKLICVCMCYCQVVGEFSMELAISKAQETGCAWVAATGKDLTLIFSELPYSMCLTII